MRNGKEDERVIEKMKRPHCHEAQVVIDIKDGVALVQHLPEIVAVATTTLRPLSVF